MKKLFISHPDISEVNSYGYWSSLKRIPKSEQPSASISWLFALRCWLVAAGCSILVGLAGCGPPSSENAPSLESRASMGGQPLSKQGPSSRIDPFTPTAIIPATSLVPLASGNEPGALSVKGTVPGVDSPNTMPAKSTKSAEELEPLVVPDWMAKDLDSPDVGTRLRALETWAKSAPPGAVDPLILAFEDKDERVRARAMELIEQDWARAADAEQ